MTKPNASRSVLFLIDRPYTGESISSALGRAMTVYGLSWEALKKLLAQGDDEIGRSDALSMDDPSESLLQVLAGAFDMEISELRNHSIPDGPSWVPPRRRSAVCLRCLRQDLKRGLVPFFRTEWAKIYTTFCYDHELPLVTMKIKVRRLADLSVTQLDYFEEGMEGAFEEQQSQSGIGHWTGKRTIDALMAWERGMQNRPASKEDPTTSSSKTVSDRAELIALLGTARSERRGHTAAGALHLDMHPSREQCRWSLVPGPLYSNSAPAFTWEAFRSCSGVESRRAAFFWAAASFDADWPMEFINAYRLLNGVRGRSADWWLSVIRTRLVGYPHDQAKVDALARRAFVSGYPDVSGLGGPWVDFADSQVG